LAPVLLTLPPMLVLPGASVVTLVKAVAAPTVLPNVVDPAVFTVKLCAPFTAPFKLMLPLLLDERIASAAKVIESLKVCAPVVLMLPPMLVLPGASVVTLVKAVVAPTVLPKVVVPAVLTVKLCAPFTVPFKLMLPLPLDERIASAAKVTASLKVCAPVVLTLPPMLALPGASVVTLVKLLLHRPYTKGCYTSSIYC